MPVCVRARARTGARGYAHTTFAQRRGRCVPRLMLPRAARTTTTQVFKRGLLDAVNKTQAWIVTGGTNSGVMGLVGKTMAEKSEHDEPIVCLGIATWGIVKNHEDMELSLIHI